jgi:ArsR family transcriptional regulator
MIDNNCCSTGSAKKRLSELSAVLRIIAEPNRLKILCLLSSETKCVCEIQDALLLKQNLVSHHLKVLKECGLIGYEKKGQWKHYFLERKKVQKYKSIFNKILTF